jgi:hypothetical protein
VGSSIILLWNGRLRRVWLPIQIPMTLYFPEPRRGSGQNIKHLSPQRIAHVTQVGIFSPLLFFRSRSHETPSDIQERGGEATVEVLSLVHDMSESQGKHQTSNYQNGDSHGSFFIRQLPSVSLVY